MGSLRPLPPALAVPISSDVLSTSIFPLKLNAGQVSAVGQGLSDPGLSQRLAEVTRPCTWAALHKSLALFPLFTVASV